ncbi:MAG: ABC transporter ATP-binding protein [Candidatus Helarchaeota archaeon]
MNIISVKNLSKYYDSFCAVDNISFEVEKGKKIGLLGPNGAGKTTTIRVITGILHKTSGEIKFNNKIINPMSSHWKSKFGVVPEISNAYLDYSPFKNLMFSGGLYGLPKQYCKSKALELLTEFGLTEKKNIRTKKLSKGQKQKLNFSMALLHDPEILFLDEPTSGLDIRSANLVRNKINQLCNEGKTIFLTTHNLLEANSLCDELIILNHGKIIAKGAPKELRKKFSPASKIKIEFYKPINDFSIFNELKIDFKIGPINKEIVFFSMNPMEDFLKIHDFLLNKELKVAHLEISSASLEEIFLKILEDDSIA